MAQVQVDAAMFAQLARTARANGTLGAFVELAVDWAQKAETIALGLQDKVAELEAERDGLREAATRIRQMVDTQALDEGLWFMAETAAEAYLQQELRRLHATIEGKQPEGK